MHRVLVLLVTFLLPLQFAWGAVTAYCQHETGAASKHFGHHEHVHKAEHAKSADAGGWGHDNDCGTCHAAGLTALAGRSQALPQFAGSEAPVLMVPRRPPAPPPDTPERPQWARLA
jgi:hypothetical protein